MLVTFKSKATAEVSMYPEHAKMLLSLVGKTLEPEAAPRGIITAAEVPAALKTLRSAAEASRENDRHRPQDDDGADRPISVSLAQRAFPLIDMLERAAAENTDVMWGV